MTEPEIVVVLCGGPLDGYSVEIPSRAPSCIEDPYRGDFYDWYWFSDEGPPFLATAIYREKL